MNGREIVLAALLGFVLDLILGDPARPTHPVIHMGRVITRGEVFLRKHLPKTPRGELLGGILLEVLLVGGTLLVTGGALWLAGKVHPALRLALEVLWCWQALAIKSLAGESRNVWRALTEGTLEEARQAVGRIVGRDTAALTAEGVTKAAVETVAENFSDGVAAPLFWMLIGGAPLAMCYKAVNTMDSMVGYKNERYLYFGRAGARVDDAANYIPSRLAAFFLMAAAALTGHSVKGAFKVWKRDRRKHASPNSAQTEAVMAGALQVQLAGPASYFGVLHEKPFIGDPVRAVEAGDILRANRMMVTAGILALVIFCGIRMLLPL